MYIVSGIPDNEASDSMITGMISICHQPTVALFDPDSIYSYVFTYFASKLEFCLESLFVPFNVSTPVGDSIVVD